MPKVLYYRATVVFEAGSKETITFDREFADAYPAAAVATLAEESAALLKAAGKNAQLVGVATKLTG
jgi:hypothetical protein